MDKEVLKYRISVEQAYLDGEEIESKRRDSKDDWYTSEPVFIWDTYDYRVKKKPKVIYVPANDKGNLCGATWYHTQELASDKSDFKKTIKFVEETK